MFCYYRFYLMKNVAVTGDELILLKFVLITFTCWYDDIGDYVKYLNDKQVYVYILCTRGLI